MFKILISDKLGQAGLDRLAEMNDVTYDMKTGLSPEELAEILPNYDALIVRSGTKVTADLLAAGENLVVVGRAGIGVDNVDIGAATRRGIIVMNTPAANSIATAEQTMALMLAVSRHTAVGHQSLKEKEWRRSEFVGTQLYGKTLGVVGFGKIGRLVAERAQAFGMKVIAYDPYVSEEVGRQLDVLLVDLDDLLGEADYVTLHTALLPETTNMINAQTLSMIKEGAVLINCARGKLIDEAALAEALTSGKLKAAALDVYSSEPPPESNPLIGLPNVLHTPHLGASSVEAQRDVATQIVEQVVDALRGADFRNTINMPFQVSNFNEIRPYLDLAEKLGTLQAGLADGLIQQVEIEVHGEDVSDLVRAIASAMLKGILQASHDGPLNYINAPVLAEEAGIKVTQTVGKAPLDYPNLIACRARWANGERLLGGVLFGGSEPRLVRVDHYTLEARPEGVLLVMQNKDVPGVIGQIGTILAAYEVNIGEWRMGRDAPGGEALCVINLDSEPQAAVLDALEKITAVTQVKLVTL